MNGFIKLHRQLLDWEWYGDINVRLVFIHCLLKANFKDKRWQGQLIKRGQFISSLGKLSEGVGISKQQLRTALEKLKKTGEITTKGQGNNTLFIVNKYNDYQDFTHGSEDRQQHTPNTPSTHHQHTGNTSITTTEEGKKDKKEEKENKYIVDYLDVCSFFELETGKNLRQGKTESKIKNSDKFKIVKARFNDGATVEELKSVIRLKNKQWKDDHKMKQYIQFSTLFGKRNFDKYMDEIINSQSYVAPKTTAYQVPDFDTPEERQFFFLRRYTKYTETGILEQRLINTEYRQRALMEKDAEGMCYFLENKYPELLNVEQCKSTL